VELAIKLAKRLVICENASGGKKGIDLHTVRRLIAGGLVASLKRRQKDGAIVKVMLLAEPNEIATRITAQTEVVELGKTWVHTRNLGLFGQARG